MASMLRRILASIRGVPGPGPGSGVTEYRRPENYVCPVAGCPDNGAFLEESWFHHIHEHHECTETIDETEGIKLTVHGTKEHFTIKIFADAALYTVVGVPYPRGTHVKKIKRKVKRVKAVKTRWDNLSRWC